MIKLSYANAARPALVLAAASVAASLSAMPALADPATASARGGAGASVPGDRARRPSSCRALRGRDLAPARNVKLVRRRNRENGTDLLGCVLGRRGVREIASSRDLETTTEGYTVEQVAGTIVLLASSYGSQYASDRRVSVSDIRTGRRYVVARSCSRVGSGPCGGQNATAAAAFVNDRGQAVAAIVPDETQTTMIVGFSSRGERRELDSGPSAEVPASSLRLDGSTVRWTHSGEARSATLCG